MLQKFLMWNHSRKEFSAVKQSETGNEPMKQREKSRNESSGMSLVEFKLKVN